MKTIELSVARDFSRTPGSRYRDEGDFSGEEFREELLQPAVKQALVERSQLHVNLDGTAGYGTSFLEEAFGGLVRSSGFTGPELLAVLRFTSKEEVYLVEDILGYINDAEQVRATRSPAGAW
ncbi:MAG TPA: STAS-like domain-containing protein [Longimicrobiaceae bacterium]|nr:STAS-like domain-containing protein [Longimicrobiaceae bacterium]